MCWLCQLALWCWTPLSIFQLYRDVRGNRSTLKKITDLSQVTNKLYHIMLCISPWSRFELTSSVVIGTNCIGSCKSNYHTITATTAPVGLIESKHQYHHRIKKITCDSINLHILSPSHSFDYYVPLNYYEKTFKSLLFFYLVGGWIRVITKLPNSEQSYKRKVKTHKYINRQNQSTTWKLWKS